MVKIPKFHVYGDGDSQVEEAIQPKLDLRGWEDLTRGEKEIIFQEIVNRGWITGYSSEILYSIEDLNHHFLRECPGKELHNTPPRRDREHVGMDYDRTEAAYKDFKRIFLDQMSEALVFRMLTKFAKGFIDYFDYGRAQKAKENAEIDEYIEKAFKKFDRLAGCLNHIFEQFAVNAVLTRQELIPRQDEKITNQIHVPVLQMLSNPQWEPVSRDLSQMFEEYRSGDYPETITKAHGVIQRFLQILVGKEGKNGRGEVGKLFSQAKAEKLIPINRFTEPIINVFQGFISSERATNSTAKPALKKASAQDALLVINVVMVLLQHCLTDTPDE